MLELIRKQFRSGLQIIGFCMFGSGIFPLPAIFFQEDYMLIDISLKLTEEIVDRKVIHLEGEEFTGHVGTHMDVMDKGFPLEYSRREGILFDVRGITDRDIDVTDVSLDEVRADSFVVFYSGFIAQEGYGTFTYEKKHPQLSDALIAALLEKHISLIGIDFAGIRRPPEHGKNDQLCADHGTYVIENLSGLDQLLSRGTKFSAYILPLSMSEHYSGLPCRVIAEI